MLFILLFSSFILSQGEIKEEPSLTINEPMYFIIGKSNGDIKARMQFSFKYRLFDEKGIIVKNIPQLKNFHFGYTQTSLWNISAISSPFEDSSYRPSLFWEFGKINDIKRPDYLRIGYEHESNGQGGNPSRSIDTLFFLSIWEFPFMDKSFLIGPKIYFYISKGNHNEDIEDYRGFFDLILRYGNEDSWIINLLIRHSFKGKYTLQMDYSYPIREKIFSRAGGYIYLQAFYGYGETLLTYNKKEGVNFRLGFAIVR